MAVMVDERFCLSKVEKRGCFNNDGGRTPVVTTNLRDLDEEWRTNLQRPESPPLLGLAPLGPAGQAALNSAVDYELRTRVLEPAHRVDGLIRLLARRCSARSCGSRLQRLRQALARRCAGRFYNWQKILLHLLWSDRANRLRSSDPQAFAGS